jgi:4-diphosphocytidyl-2-C-methyl-D-erythritol kinase
VIGAEIPGENILIKGCRYLRSRWGEEAFPYLSMRVFKHVPAGSGLGAGSGNAAALLRWFGETCGPVLDAESILPLGADVAFLASDADLAFVSGAGEVLNEIPESLDLRPVLFFPEWSSDTREAYISLDRIKDRALLGEAESRAESRDVLDKLSGGRKAGLLPNDFIQCFKEQEDCYNALYDFVESSGALAWGLCGSGSACFALYGRGGDSKSGRCLSEGSLSRFKWLKKVMFL